MHKMSNCASIASNQVTSRRIVQNHPTAPSVEQKDTYLQSVLQRARTVDQWTKDENFEETKEMKTAKLTEEWKCAQDQPQFSNRNNKCLNCAGDHQTCDCPTRKQHWAPTTSNPASGTGIYQNHDQFQNTSLNHNSPQQQQQSQSTVGVTTPTLIVNNPKVQPGLHA